MGVFSDKMAKRIVNRYGGAWGYKDIPFQKYDEVEVIPEFNVFYGRNSSVELPELKRILKVGKIYRVKSQYLDKKLKAKLVAIYSDPVGFENRGKNTNVRLKTEWEFQDPIGSYPKGKHEIIEDLNLDYRTRSNRMQKVQNMLRKKHGTNQAKAIEELKNIFRGKI